MSDDDKQVFQQGRPYIVGVIALLFRIRAGAFNTPSSAQAFNAAEEFVLEFEKRNGIEA